VAGIAVPTEILGAPLVIKNEIHRPILKPILTTTGKEGLTIPAHVIFSSQPRKHKPIDQLALYGTVKLGTGTLSCGVRTPADIYGGREVYLRQIDQASRHSHCPDSRYESYSGRASSETFEDETSGGKKQRRGQPAREARRKLNARRG
jgi:hypothetical protein